MSDTTTPKKPKCLWVIKTDEFGDASNPFVETEKRERKFNLKIRTSDLELLDAFADQYKISRATLLNYLIKTGLQRMVLNLPDNEVRALIVHRADSKLFDNDFDCESFWVDDLYRDQALSEVDEIMHQRRQYEGCDFKSVPFENRHSEDYVSLYKLFRKIDQK